MNRPALLTVGALLLTTVALATPPAAPATRILSWTIDTATCPSGVGTCYAYNGSIPGPTLDVDVGDTIELTVTNHLPQNASFHVHGMVLAVASDGIPSHAGTRFPDSSVPPNGSFTYRFRAAYPGTWHYHDHVMGADGSDGARHGLYGTVVVRGAGEPRPATVLDLHVLDVGAAARVAPFRANVSANASFELDATVLGNDLWDIEATAPGGAALAPTVTLGPATSQRYSVAAPAVGTYTWTAHGEYYGGTVTGEVVAS